MIFKVVWAVSAALALAACGGGTPTGTEAQPDPLPPRPRTIAADGLDPCVLVPPDVLKQVGVPDAPRPTPPTAPNVRHCAWERGAAQAPSGALGVTVSTQQDVRNVLSVRGAQVSTVAGFGAVEIPDDRTGAEFSCDVRVDIAPGQGLWVTWFNTLGDEAGATHELMCERAHRAAEGVMQQLLATRK